MQRGRFSRRRFFAVEVVHQCLAGLRQLEQAHGRVDIRSGCVAVRTLDRRMLRQQRHEAVGDAPQTLRVEHAAPHLAVGGVAPDIEIPPHLLSLGLEEPDPCVVDPAVFAGGVSRRHTDRLTDGHGEVRLVCAHPAVAQDVGQVPPGEGHLLRFALAEVIVVVVDLEEAASHLRIARIAIQGPHHLVDACRGVHDVDQQLGRHIADAEEHPPLVGGEIVEDHAGVRRPSGVLVDPPFEWLIVDHADGGGEIAIGLEHLAAVPPEPIEQGIDLRRLLLIGFDQKGQSRGEVVVFAQVREQIKTNGLIRRTELPHEPQRKGSVTKQRFVIVVRKGDDTIELCLKCPLGLGEVAGLLQLIERGRDAAANMLSEV